MTSVHVVSGLLPKADLAAVLELCARAEGTDGTPPVSDQTLLALRRGASTSVLVRDPSIVAYAGLELSPDACVAELVVDPLHRRRGLGSRLTEAVLTTAADRVVRAWAHGSSPAASVLAARYGFVPVRELRQLRRRLADAPEVHPPPGVRLRAFRPGADDSAWLTLNAAAFADHPEQGRWTTEDLQSRLTAEWFDPAGFLLAERDGELVGFHWTKRHSATVGEVYVLGVHPSAQGAGLGRVLLSQGLAVLRRDGVEEVLLYVDGDNAAAVQMYERGGFSTAVVDLLYERASSRLSAPDSGL